MTEHPTTDLYRAMQGGITSEDGKTLTIRLAPHDQWAEIQSTTEGNFMERFSRSAYRKTMAENPPKILFNHGRDPEIGEKVIATTDEVGEDATSPYARGQILDGLPELVVDGIRKGVYGASHRFSVVREKWDDKPIGGQHNPKKLPERTITEARLFELGPVTWPAYAQASVSLRSVTDEYREPVAPSLDAEPEAAHLEPERRDEPVTIAAPEHKESPKVDIAQYHTLDEMGARVRELDAEIKRAAELPGVLPDVEQVAFDEKVAERAALDHAMTAWRNRLAQVREAPEGAKESVYEPVASFVRKTESDIFDPAITEPYRYRSTEQWAGAQRDNAMRITESTTFQGKGHIDQARAREDVQHVLDNCDTRDKQAARRVQVTQAPIYRRAFNKMAAGEPLTAEEERGTAMVVTTDGNGGFAVPFAFDPTWLHTGAWTNVNGIRANARVVQIVGTDTWHGTTVNAVTAIRGAEATEQAEQGPTLTRPEILASRVSVMVGYSIEMGQDVPGLGAELASLIGEAKDTEEEAVFTVGVGGANTCLGIAAAFGTVGIYTSVKLATDHTLAAVDAYNMEAALPIRHRQGAAWYMARPMIRSYQALETANGQLFGGVNYGSVGYPQNSIVGATGLELLRYPIVETPSMPYDYVTGGNDLYQVAVLANLKNSYVIVDRIGMSVEFIPHLFHADGKLPIGRRGLYALWRNGAEIVNVDGGRVQRSTNA